MLLIGWNDVPWGRRRRGDDKAALLALIEADDALVARRRALAVSDDGRAPG